jgi:hypothetical protein
MTRETRRFGWALPLILWAVSAPAEAPARPATEDIGSWVLSCPAAVQEPCLMRHRDWVVPPVGAGPTVALEVQARGDALVPVISLRGLPASAAVGGALLVKPTVSLAFDNGKRIDLTCGLGGASFACAPDAASVRAAADALPKARNVAVAVKLSVPGGLTLPPRDRSLDLAGTEAALTRLRALGATGEALPAYPGLDLQGFADRTLRDAGFPNGVAGALPAFLTRVGR